MLMSLGMFVFELAMPYEDLQRQTGWRHAANGRIGQRPVRQFVGPGDDTITLTGVLHPEITAGSLSLDALRVMGDSGKAWTMIEGTGRIYGQFIIEGISEKTSGHFADGAARRIEFSVTLQRVDTARVDQLGALSTSKKGR